MIVPAAVLSVLFCSVHSFTVQTSLENSDSGSSFDDDDLSVSMLIQKANLNVGKDIDGPLRSGDIALPTGQRNADPCTDRDCLWPKSEDGNVYVPYRISPQFSQRERSIIMGALRTFTQSTCIRFTPLTGQRDYVDIVSDKGCYSYVGRTGIRQVLSLDRQGCVYEGTVQHELLHTLGFTHEHSRSDRDKHVRILLENVQPGQEDQFQRIETNNIGTPYDYNSVMHYGRYVSSKNGQPTILPVPDNNVEIGTATKMSPTDIQRVNRLYRCNRSTTS